MPVEELQNLNCDLAAVVEAVAKLRGGEFAIGRMGAEVDDDLRHLRHGVAQKEMIVGDLVELGHAAQELEQAPHIRLARAKRTGEVAHPRRAKALRAGQQRGDPGPQSLVSRRQAYRMSGQPQPGAIERNLAVACKLLQRGKKHRRRQSRFELPARWLKPDSWQLGIRGVKFLLATRPVPP